MRLALIPLAALTLGGAYFVTRPDPPPNPDDFTCPTGGRALAVFIDRSASAAADEATRALFSTTVRKAVNETIACEGDAVLTFLVHRETDGKAGADRFVSRVENTDLTEKSSGGARSARSAYRQQIARERRNALRRTLHVADEATIASELRMHTDLLGMLPVVAEELPPGAADERRVLILSDLNESMSGPGRRDFDRRPPTSREEAEAWAAEDVAFVTREYRVAQDALAGVELVPVLGSLANKPSFSTVKAYWETLWTAFGATEIDW